MRKDIRIGMLPDPFIFRSGARVSSVEDWQARRREILEDAVGLEYGGMPPAPEVFRLELLDYQGRGGTVSYRIHCGRADHPFTFTFMAYVPKREGRMPVVLTGDAVYPKNCNDRVIEEAQRRGFVVVKFNRTELAPDFPDPTRSGGIYPLWPELRFTAISAWAWGYHRVVDALMQLDFVDPDRIAITGHSRGAYLSFMAAREVWKLYGAEEKCAVWYREGGHAHGWVDFNALFDFMEADLNGTPLSEAFTRVPYDDMEPLYEYTCP